jgi:hypothetical protein
MAREMFRRAGCLSFFQNMQRGHPKVEKQFALNFDGKKTQFDRMLKIIQRYFSCEGRFNTLYHYHIRLLLHFTGKVQMNVPYYLLRSIGKMSDRVQAKSKDVDSSLFHSGLIRMLVSEELGKKEISWEHFLVTSHFKMDPTPTPQS